jgi:hypothetical protein
MFSASSVGNVERVKLNPLKSRRQRLEDGCKEERSHESGVFDELHLILSYAFLLPTPCRLDSEGDNVGRGHEARGSDRRSRGTPSGWRNIDSCSKGCCRNRRRMTCAALERCSSLRQSRVSLLIDTRKTREDTI